MNECQQPDDVAAYIWPSNTGDEPRTCRFWPEGNGERETVRTITAHSLFQSFLYLEAVKAVFKKA